MYPADAEADERFRLMSLEQRGLYWTLLNHAWINDGIPFETSKLCKLVGISEPDFLRIWSIVGECFYLDNGRLRNKRQELEREAAKEVSEQRRKAGIRSGEARNEQMLNKRSTERGSFVAVRAYDSDSVSESNSSKKEKSKNDFELSDWFEQVYARHPRKKNRVLAQQALFTAVTAGIDRSGFDRVHIAWCATEAWNEKNGSFAPELAKWIEDKGYMYMPNNGLRKNNLPVIGPEGLPDEV